MHLSPAAIEAAIRLLEPAVATMETARSNMNDLVAKTAIFGGEVDGPAFCPDSLKKVVEAAGVEPL